MAMVQHFGRPTLFITFAANSRWKEITDELLQGQTAVDRPDLIARVFYLKQQQLLQEIKKKNIFGRYLGCIWTIEYQKRGLPHRQLLLFLHPDDRFLSTDHIDQIISAEIPIATHEVTSTLKNIITTTMIHGPYGVYAPNAPCMSAKYPGGPKVCSKGYPKEFQSKTILQTDGYPLYRRANDGNTHTVPVRGNILHESFDCDNRWIVPYKPYLSWRYYVHINVEVCALIQAIKYIHKYIYKGSYRTTLQLDTNTDEIQKYVQGRYIGPTEAVWCLFKYSTHKESPTVIHLAIHLRGEQPVYFAEGVDVVTLRIQMETARTTLIGFFKYNAENEDGLEYLYQEFPTDYTHDAKDKTWHIRKQQPAIGRIYHCNSSMGEKYYLRLLLTTVRGPQSFEYLRTLHEIQYPTFKSACIPLGLLADDNE